MLKEKTGIIFGVANKRSIAWATAIALHGAGARLAFTYQGDRLKENVEDLTNEAMPGSLLLPCDVTKQDEVDATFKRVSEKFGRLDFLIHSIAYAPREALGGEYLNTSRDAFVTALEISAYSLVQLSRAAAPLMTEGGSIVCMSYYGAEKVIAGYNVMGVAKSALEASTRYLANDLGPHNIRVNAISAG
ncbi:MAG: enoyl-ACP reductase, partial [Pyrinomonadaceae bacterium]